MLAAPCVKKVHVLGRITWEEFGRGIVQAVFACDVSARDFPESIEPGDPP